MKQLTINCHAAAAVKERWTMNVPNDFDTTDEMWVFDAFHNPTLYPGVTIEFIDQDVDDETNREITSWWPVTR